MARKIKSPIRVETPSFRTSAVQVWRDGWRNIDRELHFVGKCVECGRRTYAFTDGENDPRGILGDHAASPLGAEEYGYTGSDVPLCFMCANEEGPYMSALERAKRRKWTPIHMRPGYAFRAETNEHGAVIDWETVVVSGGLCDSAAAQWDTVIDGSKCMRFKAPDGVIYAQTRASLGI